jgi:8-oxo-dGTP pyrophosphatase MutT (NUDIX family)
MTRPVRPRRAASLILLRRGESGPETLLGRRSRTARFMPGIYVFPGGAVQRSDTTPWHGEAPPHGAARALRTAARAALRETFEETGFIIGRPPERPPSGPASGLSDIERAYLDQLREPAFESLVPIGRAITPTRSPIRFDAQFFLADGELALGPLHAGEELEAVDWYRVTSMSPAPISGVTHFMLRHALAVWSGSAASAAPLYRHIRGAPKVDWRPIGAPIVESRDLEVGE